MRSVSSRKTSPYTLKDRQSARFVTREFFCVAVSFVGRRAYIYPSIISLSDGSLPRKPCKTCKNLFHASCLYKVCAIEIFDSTLAHRFASGPKQVILQPAPYVDQKYCNKLVEAELAC